MPFSFSDPYSQLLTHLQAAGVPIDSPAFYDHPNFIPLEHQHPAALVAYARVVKDRTYAADYVERARNEIPEIVRHGGVKRRVHCLLI